MVPLPLRGPASATRFAPSGARRRVTLGALSALLLLAAAAPAAHAQLAGDGFLFHRPRATLTLRGGWDGAAAKGDMYTFAIQQLTLGRNDFSGPFIGLDLAIPVQPRLDVTLSSSVSGSNAKSEFRHWIDTDNTPIEQTTSLLRVPLAAGLRAYLLPRGRSVGQFVWIPERFAPYVGAAGGFMWYRFKQQGEFVDFQTTEIYPDLYTSDGWAPMAQASLGADFSLTPRLVLNGEAKYTVARGQVDTDYSGFDHIDLSGYTATLGLSVRF